MNKNPYEIRSDILAVATGVSMRNFEVSMELFKLKLEEFLKTNPTPMELDEFTAANKPVMSVNDIKITAADMYSFVSDSSVASLNGISYAARSATSNTVSG